MRCWYSILWFFLMFGVAVLDCTSSNIYGVVRMFCIDLPSLSRMFLLQTRDE